MKSKSNTLLLQDTQFNSQSCSHQLPPSQQFRDLSFPCRIQRTSFPLNSALQKQTYFEGTIVPASAPATATGRLQRRSKKMCSVVVFVVFWCFGLLGNAVGQVSGDVQALGLKGDAEFDYKDALMKSILFFEGQRSGKLPKYQRVKWRGDSGLSDGALGNVNLKGGYYDAGDNVKFGWPMSFTVSLLSWAAVEYESALSEAKQLPYLRQAIQWGAQFILKAHTSPTTLWTQVGDGNSDHQCWERPEDMDTPRTLTQINSSSPGTEPAADASAALSSAAIALNNSSPPFSARLLRHAKSLFKFADKYRSSYQASCPYYCSYSGYEDELLWAATWLYKATREQSYLKYIVKNQEMSGIVSEFSWDNKFAGAQILLAKEYFEGENSLSKFKEAADSFICSLMPKSTTVQIKTTPGGLLYTRDSSNLQYVGSAANAMTVYARALQMSNKHKKTNISKSVQCGGISIEASDIMKFAKSQVDYVLGNNPKKISYMVGFGDAYPQQLHHRGASIPSVHVMPAKVECGEGYSLWYNKDASNPNVHVGAIVGGPDNQDQFIDQRSSYSHLEPTTYLNAAFVGCFAALLPPPPSLSATTDSSLHVA